MIVEQPFDQRPYVLLCEGVGDQRFFKNLFEERTIGAEFTICVPTVGGEYAGGRPNFGRYLSSISVDEDFIQHVKAVLVVSDNDSDPAGSFAEVQEQLRIAKTFPVPDAERVVARKRGSPDVVVLMLPLGAAAGNLESLCLEAAYSKWQIKDPLDAFVAQTPPNEWSIGKQAKMRIQTVLASTNDRQPDTGFAGHWNQLPQYRIPLTHACFDGLATFLSEFSTFLEQ